MSIHMRDIGEAVLGLFHLHHAEEPQLNEDQRLLIQAYRSGQVQEAAWQEHLELDPELARYWLSYTRH
ncbi:hypothetical protein [Ensifer sp. Root127]|uniref:hypothetical protein n=1 Tax=Ensifer sp. Root127 TaxID=1736440 RepID=UPI0007102A17|nr:hypothetical protein [Ensifer sp. Root127]KQW54799.1 hypothetical protein ASD03_19740 [Ensifer sp. Root127]